MASIFAELCAAAGLSLREAAEYLDIRYDTARSYATGRREPHPDMVAELSVLVSEIDRDAVRLIESHRKSATRRKEIAVSITGSRTSKTGIVGACNALRGRIAAALMADGIAITTEARAS